MKFPTSIAATLLLHAALVAAAAIGLSAAVKKPAEPPAIAVQMVPEQIRAFAPAVAAPPPAPTPPPSKKSPAPKRVAPPKPAAKPREQAAPEMRQPEAPAPSPSPDINTAPVLPAAPPVPSAPPVKTGVSISASYAASNRKPDYPAMSKRYDEQGTVVLRVLVKADGSAGQVEIKSSSGYPLLDESARTTVQTWRFSPATSDGKPVAEWYLVPIPFTLRN